MLYHSLSSCYHSPLVFYLILTPFLFSFFFFFNDTATTEIYTLSLHDALPISVVSFLLPDAHDFDSSAANVMAKFCHFVFFFTSRSSGERWTAKHPGTFLYSPDEAFALAKRLNARNFGPELARRASPAAQLPQIPSCCS